MMLMSKPIFNPAVLTPISKKNNFLKIGNEYTCKIGLITKILVFAILFSFLSPLAFGQNTSPEKPDSTFAQKLLEILNNDLNKGTKIDKDQIASILSDTAARSLDSTQKSSILIGNTIMKYAVAVFYAIIGLVLVANITFIGFRIMLRAPIVQLFSELTVAAFILVVVAGITVDKTPTNIIQNAMYQLTVAGRNIGGTILAEGIINPEQDATLTEIVAAGKSAKADPMAASASEPLLKSGQSGNAALLEPIGYWIEWLGVKYSNTGNETEASYKFSPASLMGRFWGDKSFKETLENSVKGAEGSGKGKVNPSDMFIALVTIMAPLKALDMSVSIATIQTGAILAPVMQQVGVFSGAILSFYVVSALGISTLPLMFFSRFRTLWSSYLTVLTGIALIPCFYYIFSAIGFVFCVNIFNALFPMPTENSAATLSTVINGVFLSSLISSLSMVCSVLESLFTNDSVRAIIAGVFAWTMFLGKLSFASGVVSSIVVSGVSFALMGSNVAYRWSDGFGSEGITKHVGEMFSKMQSSVQTGLSGMYSKAASSGQEFSSGFLGKKP